MLLGESLMHSSAWRACAERALTYSRSNSGGLGYWARDRSLVVRHCQRPLELAGRRAGMAPGGRGGRSTALLRLPGLRDPLVCGNFVSIRGAE